VDIKHKTFWKIFFLIEASLFAIALILPVTPSKTGSGKNLTEYFFDNPSYFEEVLFNLIFINIIVVFIALIVMIIRCFTKKNY
jgi:hypothetical protein